MIDEVSVEPCDLHAVSNCSMCSGLDKRLQAQTRQRGTGSRRVRFERLPPGGVHARYSGRCAGCGVFYEAGEAVRYSDIADGWVSMECCG